MATVAENLQTLVEIKDNIRTAISNKGVEIAETTPFSEYPEKINEISGGGTDEIFDKLIKGTLTTINTTTPIKKGLYLFAEQKNLVTANVTLENPTEEYQFANMFDGCTALTTAPETLPSGPMKAYSCRYMFQNCSSLTKAPKLPSTNLAASCYYKMFNNCSSLTETPDLPATTLDSTYEYYEMFAYCTALHKTGKISAEGELGSSVSSMFRGCTELKETTWTATIPPSINAYIFDGCPADMIIYVPDESVTLYKEAAVWTARAEYIRPMSARPE